MEQNDSELMTIPEDEKFLRDYKSVYTAMTAKPDCRSKAYPQNVIVEINNIHDLNGRIFNKFKTQYENVGFSFNASISLQGREKLDFATWQSFKEHEWTEAAVIEGMILVWEFNIKLPKFKIPERHTLTVKISNGIKPAEMISLMLSGKLEQIDEIEQNTCPIVAKMDFVDFTIGNEVMDIVSTWVKGLSKSKFNAEGIFLFFRKRKKLLAYIINYGSLFLDIVLSVAILDHFLINIGVTNLGYLTPVQSTKLLNIGIICIVGCFAIYKVTEILANNIYKFLANDTDVHVFSITQGDKNHQDFLNKTYTKDKKSVIINIVISILLNIICGIITYFITKGW